MIYQLPKHRKAKIEKWLNKHLDFYYLLREDLYFSYAYGFDYNTEDLEELLDRYNIDKLPFSSRELLRYISI